MPSRLSDDGTSVINVRTPEALTSRVDAWAVKHGIKGRGARSAAVRLLIERGLDAPDPPKPAAGERPCPHPITRRLGTFCCECGRDVKKQ